MILYLYLQIKPLADIRFSSPISDWLKTQEEAITIIELDGHSESFLVSKASDLIANAGRIILHTEVENGEAIGALKSIFEKLRKIEKPILSVTQGDHQALASMLKLIKVDSKSISNLTEVKSLFSEFLNLETGSKS